MTSTKNFAKLPLGRAENDFKRRKHLSAGDHTDLDTVEVVVEYNRKFCSNPCQILSAGTADEFTRTDRVAEKIEKFGRDSGRLTFRLDRGEIGRFELIARHKYTRSVRLIELDANGNIWEITPRQAKESLIQK
jgi:hypothetical protein